MVSSRATRLLIGTVVLSVIAQACGSIDTTFVVGDDLDASPNSSSNDATIPPLSDFVVFDSGTTVVDGPVDPGIDAAAIAIVPQDAVITVVSGQPVPSVSYIATYSGQPIAVKWSTDRGEIGAITADAGVYTPAGTLGGTATISAFYRGITVSTTVTVKVKVIQDGDPNGASPANPLDGGAGGVGGVGGEGPGKAVTGPQRSTLTKTPATLGGLDWLYPYDQTVWPRGILAPLLQWGVPGAHTLDAIRIQLIEDNFEYDGFFAAPASSFARHPIPQDVWEKLAASNDGGDVTLKVTLAEGTSAYALPVRTFKIARGSLKGTVYYNSYGTRLAVNYSGSFGNFGGATLAIRPGATAPKLVVGSSSATDGTGCRVCHSVAANGSMLVTNKFKPDDSYSVRFDLQTSTETDMVPGDGRFSWGALSPDGQLLFSNSANLQGAKTSLASALYEVGDGGVAASVGLPPGLKAGTPVFSPNGKKVAFNLTAVGPDAGVTADQKSLAVMDFDPATRTFSNLRVVFTPGANGKPSGTVWWPSFLPTSDALVFQLEVLSNGRGELAETRSRCDDSGNLNNCLDQGTRAELWWVELATNKAARLDKLNGVGHVPPHPSARFANDGGSDFATVDTVVNYEPTVGPVPSGGYAWVVFTSRRIYGSVADINPWHSDPRYFDLRTVPNTKKLWVAAVDLNAKPGADPSHPAFYVPAQELVAANSRGYWVLDPCKSNGQSCATGDECCQGFCRRPEDGGALTCSIPLPNTCAQEFEVCATTADCCAGQGVECINGRCLQPAPDAGPPRVK